MTLATIEQNIEAIRSEADTIRTAHRRDLDTITSDERLTPAAKQQDTLNLKEQTRAKMTALRAREAAEVDNHVAALETTIFGKIGTDPISFRDAQARADAFEDDTDAQSAMTRALRSGDNELAKAIAQRAVDEGWSKVIRLFEDAHPTQRNNIRDLTTLRRHKHDSEAQFGAGLHYLV